MAEFSWPVRIYYEDTDSGGVVYYANYLKYMERCRTEFLRAMGYEQDRLIEQESAIFAVRSVSVDYLRPARFNDLLTVTAKVVSLGRASITFEQIITKQGEEKPLVTGEVKIACLDPEKFRPKSIPKTLYMELANDG